MTAQSTLQRLMDIHGENAHSLSVKTGVSQPSIRRIQLGLSREPRRTTLQPLADFFNVDISSFMLEQDASPAIPLINTPGEHIGLPPILVARMPAVPGAAFLMHGDSMQPGISPSDLIMIDTSTRNFVDDGVYLLTDPYGTFVRRVQRDRNGLSVLQDNRAQQAILCASLEDAGVSVVGRAIGVLSWREI